MTTRTTDAEAIARIIVDDFSGIIEIAKRSADRTRSTFVINRQHATTMIAGRILSYLASRREAKPVAWRWRFVDESNWTISKTRPKHDNDHDVWCEPLYTAPPSPVPAPAGEVERLRAVLKDAQAAIEQAIDCIRGESPEDMDHANAERDTLTKLRDADHAIATALNGGREDD